MRFSIFQPMDHRAAEASSLRLFGGMVLWFCTTLCIAVAQGPGTTPPVEIFSGNSGDDESEAGGLPIKAFLFLSEAESPVMMPGMTWEELQRLQSSEVQSEAYSYQELQIVGTAAERRAEMDVTLKLSIESTDNKLIPIPLRMGNFHQLAPPDVTGVEDYFMALAPGGGGYLLWVRTENRRPVTLQMKVSARVDSASTQSLDFQLPDVPSTVRIVAAGADVTGDVFGQGYETIETKKVAGGRSEFVVESGGGSFTLRWGQLESEQDNVPLLEVDSRINVSWDSPQDAPRAAVQLTVRNVRGSIVGFEILLPSGAVLPKSATLGTGGLSVDFEPPQADDRGERRMVLIPDEEQRRRIDLNFSFTMPLPSGNVSPTNPLGFRVPEVVGALRHRGEITIQTSDEYRLRWNSIPWVRSVLGEVDDESEMTRRYSFEFDRGTFQLPLWLSAKERQVRIDTASTVMFRETTATLEMLIRSSGRAADGRGPQIDMAQWRLQSIINDETGEPVDSFQGDGYPEIDFPPGSGDPPPIRIRAEQAFDRVQEPISVRLPRIVKTDDGLMVPTSQVDVVSSGRWLMVVDLEASKNLERISASATEEANDATVSSFRIESHEAGAVLVGTMVEQPQRITLASDGTVVLDGDELKTTLNWTVTSRLDLEGRLPIRFPILAEAPAAPAEEPPSGLLQNAIGLLSNGSQATPVEEAKDWNVTIGGVRATLHPLGDGRFDLVSDRLAEGTMSIRWYRTQKIDPAPVGDTFESLALPRPAIDDVTIRGPVTISLKDSHETELVSAVSATNHLMLHSLPTDPVRLRMRARQTAREELSVSQAILRTSVGREIRHEQLLAKIQGGDSFQVGLPEGSSDVSVEAYIDNEKETLSVQRDGDTLLISLPGDQSSHVVDLRVWLPESSEASIANIRPALRLPIGVGRVFYWQIVVPQDSHALWASPTLGRSMTWNFARWKLDRQPSHDDRALTAMIGASPYAMPPGHSYLYIGSDVRSFQVLAVSRVVLWMVVGSLVLLTAVLLTYLPQTRHPLTAVVGAVLFAGLLAIAPDAAVLVGQLSIIALVLVIVMIAVRSLVTPVRNDRILISREAKRRTDASTQSLPVTTSQDHRSSVSHTQALPSPTEASP